MANTDDHKVFGLATLCVCMSDTAREDFDFLGKQLLKKSQTEPLRERMEAFIDEHGSSDDLAELRRRAKAGKDVSEIVKDDRDERV